MNIDLTSTKNTSANDTNPVADANANINPGDQAAATTQKHLGSCHCGAVRFEVHLDENGGGTRCNCTICMKTAITGAAVKPAAFKLLEGEASLSSYEWGGKTARRFFCKHCGIHCFARGFLPELGGDYVSVTLNALDDIDVTNLSIVYWDGRHNNWDAGARPAPWPIFADAQSPS